MTRTLIYVIAAFALWLYFKYGSFGEKTDTPLAEKYTVKDFDKAGSGSGGTATVSTRKGGATVNPLSRSTEMRV